MRKNDNGYYTNRHSCFLLQYHLVLVTKYRHPVITGELEAFLKDYIKVCFDRQDLVILGMECMPDHVHVLFEAPPQVCLTTFINALKTATSRVVRKRFQEELRPYYWKPYFWSLSYFIGTASEATTEVVKRYIQQQKDQKAY